MYVFMFFFFLHVVLYELHINEINK